MRVRAIIPITISIILLSTFAFGEDDLTLKCRVSVPKMYRKTAFNLPPNGEPEPVRYKIAYEAFWWNCVAVRAANLNDRCPFLASGTPAASAGARDGAMNADSQIERLRQKHSVSALRRYLRSIATTPAATVKMRGYFDKPTAEIVKYR